MKKAISNLKLFHVFIRSFLIQVLVNYKYMQNVGWIYSLMPVFKSLYPGLDKRREVYSGHLRFFNTHPYMVNIMQGIVINLEEKRASGMDVEKQIFNFRDQTAGALAAIGDTMFWACWRPFSALVAILAGLVFYPKGCLVAPLVYLIFYNSFHLAFRLIGLYRGYHKSEDVVKQLSKLNIQGFVQVMSLFGMGIALGLLLIFLLNSRAALFTILTVSLCILLRYFDFSNNEFVSGLIAIVIILVWGGFLK